MREAHSEERTRTLVHHFYTYTCNKCGKAIDPEREEPDFANELQILLNMDQCVNQHFTLDLCTECLEPLWLDICHLIGMGPDDSDD